MTEKNSFHENFGFSVSLFGPLGTVKDITIFDKLFDFCEVHNKMQLLVVDTYQYCNFHFLTAP